MKKILIAFIGTVATVAAAHAQGVYAGGGLVGSRYKFDVPNVSSTQDNSGNKVSGKVFIGYEIDRMWGVEAGYTDFRGSRYSFTRNGVTGGVESGGDALYVAGKATMPVSEQMSFYGKLGATRTNFDLDRTGSASILVAEEDKTGLYAAIGGQYNINKSMAVTLEYERYGKSRDLGTKPDAISANVRFNF